jgi:protein-S-isoprenylcysteine O-methyltransferase Ste14
MQRQERDARAAIAGAADAISPKENPMQRWSFFVYGVFCHLLFLATYAAMACFVGNFVAPRSLDSPSDNSLYAVGFNVLLIGLFGLQHSIMARPWFKRIWTQLVPQAIERSTYCLASCVLLFFVMWQWRGQDIMIWNVQHPAARGLLWGLFAAGWLMVPAVSLMINHFDLFGTRQVWLYLRGRPYTSLPFRTPMLYNRMRHPLYVGWALAFWATPTMTLGHLLFAGVLTLYMAIAARIEERDLVSHFGDDYRAYQRRVPMFMPSLGVGDATAVELPATATAVSPETLAT